MIEICPAAAAEAGGACETYEVRENGKLLGRCVFTARAERGRILSFSMQGGDGPVAEALLRCVLSRMGTEGVREAAADSAAGGELLAAAGFRLVGGEWVLPLDAVARPRCSG